MYRYCYSDGVGLFYYIQYNIDTFRQRRWFVVAPVVLSYIIIYACVIIYVILLYYTVNGFTACK